MRYLMLGTCALEDHRGERHPPRGPKQRLLLAALLLQAPRVTSADRLLDLLWPRRPPADPSAALQIQISRLRTFLRAAGAGEPLQSEPLGYRLNVDRMDTDAGRFDKLVTQARSEQALERALPLLEQALALWPGEPYAEFADLQHFRGEIARLEQLHAEARERHVECLLALGRVAEALAACEPLVQADPLRERPRALQIEALYRSGRQTEALDAFEAFRRLLSDELGLDPSPALRQLKLDILRHEPAFVTTAGSVPPRALRGPVTADGLADGAPDQPDPVDPLPLEDTSRGTLPIVLAPLTGRETESEQLSALLERVRLLSVVGPGGAGKTRLAIEVARGMGGRHADGVCFVELAAVAEPERVASAIAHALGVREVPRRSPLEHLKDTLRERELLLVLDNFEHLIPARTVVRELLGACSRLRVLVTSRTPLQLAGEQEYPLPPLPVPAPSVPREPTALLQFASVRLFVERAQAVRPSFRLDASNCAAVAELCVRLDGLPLALELAAARTRMFPPEVLLRRLAEHPDVLSEEGGDRPHRHRRLSHAISWSHDLLDARTQHVFRRLAVFQGSFALEAAEAVCDDRIDVAAEVETLLQQHLVLRRDGGDEPRFHFLETIRAFARERLEASGEAAEARRRHARHLAQLAEALGPALASAGQLAALERLELEHDDLHAALAWSMGGDGVLALRLAAALWRYWVGRGFLAEAGSHLEHLADASTAGAPEGLGAEVLLGAGTVAHAQGDVAHAHTWLQASLGLYRQLGDPRGTATVLNGLAWAACEGTRLDEAYQLAAEALALCRQTGDARGEAVALNNLGCSALFRGDAVAAREALARSLEIRRRIGDRRGEAFALCNLANAECDTGNAAVALALLDEADGLLGAVRDINVVGWSLTIRARVLSARGEHAAVPELLTRALRCCAEGGNLWGRAWALTEFGANRLAMGQPAEAERLLRRALDDWRSLGSAWGERQATTLLARIPAPA